MLTDYFDVYAGRYQAYKKGNWCYEDGCVYRGLIALHEATGEDRWFDHLYRLVDKQVGSEGELAGYDPSEYNIDNILSGRSLLYLDDLTDEPRWMLAAARQASQLATHPRTRSGVYWHKLRYPWQVWLDGLYMGLSFQIGYGRKTGQDQLIEDALTQLESALQLTFVPSTGLYAHAYDEARKQAWADPGTGQSRAHWARALGWLAMALVDVADLVGPTAFARLESTTKAFLARVLDLRQPEGLWLQVIDRSDLPGNYQEMSASAMFVYALTKAERLGLLDLAEPDADGLARVLAAQAVRHDTSGRLYMDEICEVAGLGMFQNRFRDGSAAYYVSERRVADDAKGVGPLMMAEAERLRRQPVLRKVAMERG